MGRALIRGGGAAHNSGGSSKGKTKVFGAFYVGSSPTPPIMREYKSFKQEITQTILVQIKCNLCGKPVEYFGTEGLSDHKDTPAYFSYKNMNTDELITTDLCIRCADLLIELMKDHTLEKAPGIDIVRYDPMGG